MGTQPGFSSWVPENARQKVFKQPLHAPIARRRLLAEAKFTADEAVFDVAAATKAASAASEAATIVKTVIKTIVKMVMPPIAEAPAIEAIDVAETAALVEVIMVAVEVPVMAIDKNHLG